MASVPIPRVTIRDREDTIHTALGSPGNDTRALRSVKKRVAEGMELGTNYLLLIERLLNRFCRYSASWIGADPWYHGPSASAGAPREEF